MAITTVGSSHSGAADAQLTRAQFGKRLTVNAALGTAVALPFALITATFNLIIKIGLCSFAQSIDRSTFFEAKQLFKKFGGTLPSIFHNTLGLIEPKEGNRIHKLLTTSTAYDCEFANSGSRGLLSSYVIRRYENYTKSYVDKFYLCFDFLSRSQMSSRFNGQRDELFWEARTNWGASVKKIIQLYTDWIVVPRVKAVVFMVSVVAARVLDLGIGVVLTPFALLYTISQKLAESLQKQPSKGGFQLFEPKKVEKLNDITFKALQGLTVLHDIFVALHNLLFPASIDLFPSYSSDSRKETPSLVGNSWD